jgi:hypothetical protein
MTSSDTEISSEEVRRDLAKMRIEAFVSGLPDDRSGTPVYRTMSTPASSLYSSTESLAVAQHSLPSSYPAPMMMSLYGGAVYTAPELNMDQSSRNPYRAMDSYGRMPGQPGYGFPPLSPPPHAYYPVPFNPYNPFNHVLPPPPQLYASHSPHRPHSPLRGSHKDSPRRDKRNRLNKSAPSPMAVLEVTDRVRTPVPELGSGTPS